MDKLITNKTLASIIIDALFEKNLLDQNNTGLFNNAKWEEAEQIVFDKIDRYYPATIQQYTLDHFYNMQFVQNEHHSFSGGKRVQEYSFDFPPVIKGTVAGVVDLNGVVIQTFVADPNGVLSFTPQEDSLMMFVEKGEIDHNIGTMMLYWNKPPLENKITCSYEYYK